MPSQINASNSGFGGIVSTGDSSGVLELQTTGTTAVTIDTSQRVGFVAGTAAAPAITRTGDTNTGMFFPAADTIAFAEGGVEAMRLDASGNVGIGTTNPANFGANTRGITLDGTGNFQHITWRVNGTTVGDVFTNGTSGFFIGTENSSPVQFQTAGAERMRVNTNGNLLIGTTTEAANETRIVLSTNSGTTRWSVGPWSSVATNFYISATSAAQGVYLSGPTASSWSGLSDERAKDIIEPIENAIEKVSTLRAVIGRYKLDNEDNRKAFLIAQDVQAVLPEAVSIANPENGHLGLSYTDVIPLLVAAIKEQTQIINDLKARIETLEAK